MRLAFHPTTEMTLDGTAYERHGDPSRQPTVVLIHGLGLSRRLFDPMIEAFAEDFAVLLYDLYGHGESAPPPRRADLPLYAAQIAGLMDATGVQQAALVGFSIGGMINRRFALDFPDRLSALAILNSPHDRGEDAQQMVEDRAARVREQGTMSTLPDALKRWFTPRFLSEHPGQVDLVRQWRAQVDPEGYAQTAWVLAHGVRELIRPAQAITAPTLVMTCENDSGSTPAMSHAIAAEIPGAQTQIVPTLQHLGLMEDPKAFTDPTIAFLKRTLS